MKIQEKKRLIKKMIAAGIITLGMAGAATSAVMYANAVKNNPENYKSSDLNKAAALTFGVSGVVAASGAYYAAKTDSEIADEIYKEVLERNRRKQCNCKKRVECEEAEELTPDTKHNDGYSYQDYLNSLGK